MTDPPQATAPAAPKATAAGIFSGLFLTGVLHLAVSLAVILIGGSISKDGWYAVFAFWILLGLLQWIYLYPATRFSRSRGWPGVTLGIWMGGAFTLCLSLLQLALTLTGPLAELVTGNSMARVEYYGNESRVVSIEAGQVVVREGLGTKEKPDASETEAFVITPETKFDFRGPAWRDQTRPADVSWLRPGRRLNVEYVMRRWKKTATSVLIWVETKEP